MALFQFGQLPPAELASIIDATMVLSKRPDKEVIGVMLATVNAYFRRTGVT